LHRLATRSVSQLFQQSLMQSVRTLQTTRVRLLALVCLLEHQQHRALSVLEVQILHRVLYQHISLQVFLLTQMAVQMQTQNILFHRQQVVSSLFAHKDTLNQRWLAQHHTVSLANTSEAVQKTPANPLDLRGFSLFIPPLSPSLAERSVKAYCRKELTNLFRNII